MTLAAQRFNVTVLKVGGVLTVKILAMKEHLKMCPKDVSSKRRLETIVSQRYKMLKYLCRKNLPVFVETCKAIGVDPKSIRA
jgi:ribosomal protein S15